MNKRLDYQAMNAKFRRPRAIAGAAAAGLALLLFGGQTSMAASIVNDSYNIGSGPGEYTAGATLDGQPSNTPTTGGWDGAWTANAATSESGGLEYTGIPGVTIGGTGGDNGHVDTGGSGGNERGIATNATLGSASVLWMRILWRPNSTLGPEFFNFRRDGTSEGRIVIRRNTTVGNSGERNDLAIDSIAAGNDISPNNFDPFPTLSGGDTHLLLFKLTIDRGQAASTIRLSCGPTPPPRAKPVWARRPRR